MKILHLLFLTLIIFSGCESVTPKKSAPIPKDTTAPILTLLGDSNMTLSLHQQFIDPGAKASDDFDGDISNKIEINGTVDSDRVGVYTLKYQVSDSAGNSAEAVRMVRVTTFANARLGVLADADVTIYKIEDNGSTLMQWSTKSSKSPQLEKSAKFDTQAQDWEDNKLYLIKVTGGSDLDSNNNGIQDTHIIPNKGTLRALVTKKDLIDLAQKLNITPLSEIAYEATIHALKHNYSLNQMQEALNSFAKKVIKDLNGDGIQDYKDILYFDPSKDKEQLLGLLHYKFDSFVNNLRDGKLPLFNAEQNITTIKTVDFARNITPSSDGTKLYVADGNGGITIIDRANNSVIETIKTKGFARHIALNADESIAYVADSEAGLSVIDMATKKVINTIPTYDANATGDHDARYIQLTQDGNRLYLAASSSGVLEFDTTTPTNPQLINSFNTPDIAYNIKLSSDEKNLFIADGKSGLLVANLEDNTTLGSFDTFGSANSVTLSKNETKAYIADGYKGVVVADISDPSSISFLSHIDTPDFASSITLNKDESLAYVADRKSNIQIIDLKSEPMKIIQSLSTPYRTYAILLSTNEDYLYAATGTNGIEVLTTTALPNPFIVKYIPSDYKAYRIKKCRTR